MVSVVIGTAAAISAYFIEQAFSGHSLNGSNPIKGQPLPLLYYLWVFGCGLVFWLLVLLWPNLHYSGGVMVSLHTGDQDPRQKDIREVGKLIPAITIINLCGCLALPVRTLPLLVSFLVLFQLSSFLALLLLIWASFSIDNCFMLLEAGISKRTEDWRRRKEKVQPILNDISDHYIKGLNNKPTTLFQYKGKSDVKGNGGETRPVANIYVDRGDGYGGEAGASGSEHAGDGDGGYAVASGSNHGSEADGSEESGGGYGGDGGGGGGEGQGDPEHGVRETNEERTFKISKISEMSIMLTAQTTAAVIGFHLSTPSSSTKVLLVVVLVDQLVAYLCGLTSMLLELKNPCAARVFSNVGFACTTLGYILIVAMFVHWYLVLITVFLFGVVWIIFFHRIWYPLVMKITSCISNRRVWG